MSRDKRSFTTTVNTNTGSIINGDNHGTITLGSAASEPVQPYERRILVELPRQGLLGVLTSVAALITFVTGWQSIRPGWELAASFVAGPEGPDATGIRGMSWVLATVFGFLLVAILSSCWRHVRRQTFQPSRGSLFPVLAGICDGDGHRRLALVRFKAVCIRCGGKMRFYNKPTSWVDVFRGNRKIRRTRIVNERVPAAECRRNSHHWAQLD